MMRRSSDDPRDLRRRIGTTLGGEWRIEDLIGAGATAAVYRARGPDDQVVAVKVLHTDLAESAVVRRRFAREAEVARLLDLPGVVRVFASGATKSGTPFIVMELLEGETFEQRAERKGNTLPIFEVLWMTDRVLDVLIAAHRKNVIHRDIKPENIFLCSGRRVKLLDFGVAKLQTFADETNPMTTAGHLVGTLAFMPPEQARGEGDFVGIQSDLWALGATMFTLLTGRIVHEGAGLAEVFVSATGKPPPSLGDVMPDAPQALVELVDFALCYEIEKRWSDAGIMQRAVREIAKILEERRSLRMNIASPSDFSEPVSESLLEYPTRLGPVEAPPPTSRATEVARASAPRISALRAPKEPREPREPRERAATPVPQRPTLPQRPTVPPQRVIVAPHAPIGRVDGGDRLDRRAYVVLALIALIVGAGAYWLGRGH